MGIVSNPIRLIQERLRAGQRKRRVTELQHDEKVLAGVRDGLESERQGKGVSFEDLKRSRG